jgi:TPR repeat protein
VANASRLFSAIGGILAIVSCREVVVVRILIFAILLLGGAGSALAGVEAGIEAYTRGDYLAARNNLGLMFEQGGGVTRDYVRAYAWFTRAAKGPGLDPDRAALNQARLAAKMTPEERAAARHLLAEWGL